MNKVKELVARELYRLDNLGPSPLQQHERKGYHAKAEAILNLCYKCRTCKGSGEGCSREGYKCSTCKGTGQGEKMLAVVCENQELPWNPYLCDTQEHTLRHFAFEEAIRLMTTPKDDMVWKKVKL